MLNSLLSLEGSINMSKTIFNEKGLTLVEVLVVVVLIVTVLSLGYTVIHYSRTTFQSGTARAEVQQDARLAANFIADELRNAIEINTDNGEKSIGFSESDGALNVNGDELLIDKINSITLDVEGEGENGRAILGINIEGNDYEYKKEILLNNLSEDDDDLNIGNVSLENTTVYYSLPE